MIKQFIKDSFIYGFANILSRGILFLLVPFYTRVLSPEDYGVIDMLTIFGALMNLTVSLEISQGLARLYPDAYDDADRIAYSSSALWFTLITYILFAIIALVFSEQLTLFLIGSAAWLQVFQVAVISIVANGVFYLLQNQLRWQLKPKLYAASSIIFTVATTGISIVLVFIMKYGTIGIFCGQIAGAIIGCIISWFFARNNYKLLFFLDKCKEMLKFSIPLVPSSINVFIMLYIDRIAIKKLMTLGDVGIYGIGYRFASIVSILMVGFTYALTPIIYSKYTHKSTPDDIARIFRYFLAVALPLLILISLFSKELLWLLATPQYYSAWSIIPIIAAAILLSSMYIFMPGLDIAKKTKNIVTINIIAALSNTALNFILIPFIGISGAALSSLVSSFVMFSLYTFFSQRFYFVPHSWQKIIKTTIFSLVIIALGLAGSYYFSQYAFAAIFVKTFIGISCIFIIVWQLIGLGEIQKLKYYLN